MPESVADVSATSPELSSFASHQGVIIDMVVCSFALHLLENPSELFALLWELSTKARWLVILAPHKKPDVRISCFSVHRHNFLIPEQIKDGWGWSKWSVEQWKECSMHDTSNSKHEILHERQVLSGHPTLLSVDGISRVHCRIFRSYNV